MKKKLHFIMFGCLIVIVFTGCSSSNSDSNSNEVIPPGQSISAENNWGEMNWDQNNWE